MATTARKHGATIRVTFQLEDVDLGDVPASVVEQGLRDDETEGACTIWDYAQAGQDVEIADVEVIT